MTLLTHLPTNMVSIEITQPGGPKVLVPVDRPTPMPAAGEILVKVSAAGVNRPDVMQRRGQYAPPPGASDIPGLEVAGIVVAVAADVSRFKIGDKVCGLVAGGGYAQYCVIHETNALPIPPNLTEIEAAALPETFFTVWTNLFQRGHFTAGETVLIHGGSSGIGTTAIILSKAFGAKIVIVTVGSEEKRLACLALGADIAINYHTDDFVAETKRATAGKGVDVIIDLIAGDYVARNYEAAAMSGRIVQIGTQNGNAKDLNLMLMLLKRLTHTGSTLRSRTVAEKALIATELEQHVWPLLCNGQIKPLIFQTFPLKDAAKAHELMESSTHIGKIVLTTDGCSEL
ncbi:NAD(P)H-quinone oxidoreductase [Yersinia kristensenii]|uniref:NAD(P)H-quinone oxidoreductase n=1 Tax=Yersinia kristensenii TaxID=28152 RepID=UPI0011A20928|nr:NAD(P)H-quinone oxidoreductase [Yersinia kristensenii]MBW5811026.1 NAD(P)H-quinone oxidoreductase [Yersinia kristensenii]MBW5814944.1 NAD(P)H-quinone oxidoreductase [Yersinia kristensenii]MBW5828300.1 NAD(P)H-quinone oxidoreductase [Yersinia kristensenii]MBW5840480.1 NAD(P)H-quinone oxidoreductase [Yersinia kristensenii]MDA5488390.1 NAD(P)H-quinone oxidoreductase [Yersinia kristensenii]